MKYFRSHRCYKIAFLAFLSYASLSLAIANTNPDPKEKSEEKEEVPAEIYLGGKPANDWPSPGK